MFKRNDKNTLRYFHDKTCPGVVIDKETLPVKKRSLKKDDTTNIPKDVIENEVKKRIESSFQDRLIQKLKQKEERIKKLSTQTA